MYNSTECELIVLNDKFISIIAIYYFDFESFLNNFIGLIFFKKKPTSLSKNTNKKKYKKWAEKLKGQAL